MIGGLGCKLPPPGAHAGVKASLSRPQASSLPRSVDQRPSFDEILSQGEIGSCVLHATTGGCHQRMAMQGLGRWRPARLPAYRQCLERDGVFPADEGTFLETAVGVLHDLGFADEKLAPYDDSASAIRRPIPPAYLEACGRAKLVTYMAVALDQETVKFELAAGNSVAVALSLRESFDRVGDDGEVPVPSPREEEVGGHAMRLVGYDESGCFAANSWGRRWGRRGYCHVPWLMILGPEHCRSIYSIQAVQVVE